MKKKQQLKKSNFPKQYHEYFQQGTQKLQQRRYEEAVIFYKKAERGLTNSAYLYNNLGIAYKNLQKFTDAEKAFKRAIQLQNSSDVQVELGIVYLLQDKLDFAREMFNKVLERDNNHQGALINSAILLRKKHDLAGAIHILEKLYVNHSNNSDFLLLLIESYFMYGNFPQALETILKLIIIAPTTTNFYNLGLCYMAMQDHVHAEQALNKGLALDPLDIKCNIAMGKLFHIVQDKPQALYYFQQGVNLLLQAIKSINRGEIINFINKLGDTEFQGVCCYAYYLLCECSWEKLEELKYIISVYTDYQLVNNIPCSISPFLSLLLLDFNKYQLIVATSHARRYFAPEDKKFAQNKANNKIKLGYISANFKDHPSTLLITPVLKTHNRNNFEIFCFATVKYNDNYQQEVEKASDYFIDISMLSHYDAAKEINNCNIDILIDLSGYVLHNILAYQPAPIQIHYLDWPGTLGAPYIQYYISHPTIILEHAKHLYREKILYLDHSFIATPKYEIPQQLSAKAQYNLPDNCFVYACLNNAYRICKEVFKCWMQILKEVPNSVLWLTQDLAELETNLINAAKNFGIDPARLVFRPNERLSENWHHCLADLCLDTFTLSGGTATILCLNGGVPVITVNRDIPISRLTTSFLHSSNMSELVVTNNKEYIELAIKIGSDPLYHQAICSKLKKAKETSNLFDLTGFVKDFEDKLLSLVN